MALEPHPTKRWSGGSNRRFRGGGVATPKAALGTAPSRKWILEGPRVPRRTIESGRVDRRRRSRDAVNLGVATPPDAAAHATPTPAPSQIEIEPPPAPERVQFIDVGRRSHILDDVRRTPKGPWTEPYSEGPNDFQGPTSRGGGWFHRRGARRSRVVESHIQFKGYSEGQGLARGFGQRFCRRSRVVESIQGVFRGEIRPKGRIQQVPVRCRGSKSRGPRGGIERYSEGELLPGLVSSWP